MYVLCRKNLHYARCPYFLDFESYSICRATAPPSTSRHEARCGQQAPGPLCVPITTATTTSSSLPPANAAPPRFADARRLPRWRNALRNRLIPLVRCETPWLARLQHAVRSPALDAYFAYTANLGTHTFFMVFLPIQFWCGYTRIGRAYSTHPRRYCLD